MFLPSSYHSCPYQNASLRRNFCTNKIQEYLNSMNHSIRNFHASSSNLTISFLVKSNRQNSLSNVECHLISRAKFASIFNFRRATTAWVYAIDVTLARFRFHRCCSIPRARFTSMLVRTPIPLVLPNFSFSHVRCARVCCFLHDLL